MIWRLPRTKQLEKILVNQLEARNDGDLHLWLPHLNTPREEILETIRGLLIDIVEEPEDEDEDEETQPVRRSVKRKLDADEDDKDDGEYKPNQRGKRRKFWLSSIIATPERVHLHMNICYHFRLIRVSVSLLFIVF